MSGPSITFYGGSEMASAIDPTLGTDWAPKILDVKDNNAVNDMIGGGVCGKVYYDEAVGDTPEGFKGDIEHTTELVAKMADRNFRLAIHLWDETVLPTYKSIVVGKLTALNAVKHLDRIVATA
jgi:hypothetical protein